MLCEALFYVGNKKLQIHVRICLQVFYIIIKYYTYLHYTILHKYKKIPRINDKLVFVQYSNHIFLGHDG